MLRIKKQLERCIVDMEGDFVLKEAHYERELCKIVKWQCFDERYYDAHDGETYIEIKKGQGQMFFNMVRYAEIYLKIGTQDTVTLFLRYSKKKQRIEEILIIDTPKILKFLNMNPKKAAWCIILNNDSKRQLHMQASATLKDMREMSSYIVYHPKSIMDKCIKKIKKFKRKRLKSAVCRKRKCHG